MSRPRFLADNDLNDAIVQGVLRREPTVEFVRLRELRLEALADPAVLQFAAESPWIIVSHDVNTMTAAAFSRLAAGQPINGLLLVHQSSSLGLVIESLILIWSASDAEEWGGQVRFLPI